MDKSTVDKISAVLGFAGVLLMLAMAFKIFPVDSKTTLFLGLICFISAGYIRRFVGTEEKPGSKRSQK